MKKYRCSKELWKSSKENQQEIMTESAQGHQHGDRRIDMQKSYKELVHRYARKEATNQTRMYATNVQETRQKVCQKGGNDLGIKVCMKGSKE